MALLGLSGTWTTIVHIELSAYAVFGGQTSAKRPYSYKINVSAGKQSLYGYHAIPLSEQSGQQFHSARHNLNNFHLAQLISGANTFSPSAAIPLIKCECNSPPLTAH